jgi:flavin-dependent dehydrogenase
MSALVHVDVLVVGGGPAGSTCAWKLRQAGADVAIVDRAIFPRHKPCAGWITPEVIDALEFDVDAYRARRTFQPFTGFRVSSLHGQGTAVRFDRPVSYGICRAEFDDYLLHRAGARVIGGVAVSSIRRAARGWVVNGTIEAAILVGAGGHFCPVVQALGFRPAGERAVVGREVELPLSRAEADACGVDPETPHLIFCDDLRGYGWILRKGDALNIGLGRDDPHRLPRHTEAFLSSIDPALAARARRAHWNGHAYLLRDASQRPPAGDGFVLVGDAAGLAYANSGEGIRPAVISGLLAAETILDAGGRSTAADLAPYEARLARRFPRHGEGSIDSWLPDGALAGAVRRLIAVPWFARHVILNRSFLRPGDRIAA